MALERRSRYLVTKDVRRLKVLNAFFTLVFTGKICLQESWSKESLEQGRLLLGRGPGTLQLDIPKPLGPDRMHSGVLADDTVRPFLVTSERSW